MRREISRTSTPTFLTSQATTSGSCTTLGPRPAKVASKRPSSRPKRCSRAKTTRRTLFKSNIHKFNHYISYSPSATQSRFTGQIGKSNETRIAERKIKLDDLRAAIERQMKEKAVFRELVAVDARQLTAADTQNQLYSEHMVGSPRR